jgi:hypothetical protein
MKPPYSKKKKIAFLLNLLPNIYIDLSSATVGLSYFMLQLIGRVTFCLHKTALTFLSTTCIVITWFKCYMNIDRKVLIVIYKYIMFGRGICEKYQSRDEQFPEPNVEGNLVSRLVFFANTPPKHDISV